MKVIALVMVAGVAALGLSACGRGGTASDGNAPEANVAGDNMTGPTDNLADAVDANASNAAAAPAATPTPAVADFPIRTGRYAANATCKEAAASDDYVTVSRNTWGEIDGDTPIGPVRNLGGNRWSLGSGLTITVSSPTSFTENGRKLKWCKP